MAIEIGRGDMLEAKVDALVNPVNTAGVMGRGLALQFKAAFPECFAPYRAACEAGELVPGKVLACKRPGVPRYVFHFPTKRHWRDRSKLEDVRDGLVDLVRQVRELYVESIAVPPLGCGLGGLDWAEVRPLIVRAFEGAGDVHVVLFEPAFAPAPAAPKG